MSENEQVKAAIEDKAKDVKAVVHELEQHHHLTPYAAKKIAEVAEDTSTLSTDES